MNYDELVRDVRQYANQYTGTYNHDALLNNAADAIVALQADLAAARALLREARDFTPGAWITGGATSLRQRIDTALFKDFAETKRARDLAYMNGYEVAKEEYRELLHKAEADLAAARAMLREAALEVPDTNLRFRIDGALAGSGGRGNDTPR